MIVGFYPGRFQLPHKGHQKVFRQLQDDCDHAYITMTVERNNDKERYPFTFDERKKLFVECLDIDEDLIYWTTEPYNPTALLKALFPNDDPLVIMAVGMKDWDRFKDRGQQGKVIPLTEESVLNTNQYFVKKYENVIENNKILSASDFREQYKKNPTNKTICEFYNKSEDYLVSKDIPKILNKLL